MAAVARRHQELTAEIARLDTVLEELVQHAAPAGFLAKQGVATQVASTLLATVGDNPPGCAPRPASPRCAAPARSMPPPGKQRRHRLNRGGDRQANSALWRIVMVRMSHDPRTKAYVARRTAEGKTTKEIIRCLKRYVAREVYKALVRPSRIAGQAGAAQEAA